MHIDLNSFFSELREELLAEEHVLGGLELVLPVGRGGHGRQPT